ncbi:speckle-type poz protein [Anaeramoeba ignava]|uniref:Speckle-type poz protein n=1 Tax=Anaeramoeba ignava TaxID=1746090 RepID=A0A9Q0LGJ7_ANAIG|nr:speckle-type poz protein [Anaeramoeba ignava]
MRLHDKFPENCDEKLISEKLSHLFYPLRSKKSREIQLILKFLYTGIFDVEEETKQSLVGYMHEMGLDDSWIESKQGRKSILQDLQFLYSNYKPDFYIKKEDKKYGVHKLILIARSDLFRGMFLSVQDSSNEVNDYSGKSNTSFQQFIHFLYFDEIQPDLPQEIVEEMFDIPEYFQLNENSLLIFLLDNYHQYRIQNL